MCLPSARAAITKGRVKEGTTEVTWLVMSNGPSDFGEGVDLDDLSFEYCSVQDTRVMLKV